MKMNNIQQYFNYLYKLERSGMKYDLTNIAALCKALGNPQNKFKSIHIAGTNGKGATASFTTSILMEHGYKTGLFTSPHILRFNERIRINGKCISDKYIKDFLDSNLKLIKRIKPSFFEVNTAMAFKYFADKKVDIAVVECGLGGRLDSTNILRPELSVITQIGMDHMQYLGNTLKKIALEKIGIVKQNIDVIVSDNNKSLKKLFKKKINPDNLIYIDDNVRIEQIKNNLNGSRFFLYLDKSKREMYSIPVPGKFQARNAVAAILSSMKYLQESGFKPVVKMIKKGLLNLKTNTGYRCRLETVKLNKKEFIFDISHNADGIKETYLALKSTRPDIVIFGMMDDKDITTAIKELLKISNTIIFTKTNYKRAAKPEYLYSIAEKYCSPKQVLIVKEKVSDALKFIIKSNKGSRRVLITGSFFIVSDAIKALKIQHIIK